MEPPLHCDMQRTLSYLSPNHWAYNKNLKDPGFDLRKAIYDRVQEIMLDACVMAPFFSYSRIYAKKKSLGGYEINPYTTDICMFIQDWYWI